MEWTLFRLLIAFIMLATGSLNTLLSKWADRTEAWGSPGYPKRTFQHPFFQAICMFVGEMLCGVVFLAIFFNRRRKGQSTKDLLGKMVFNLRKIFTEKGAFSKSFFVFFPPAVCDIIGTSLLYIALNYTTAASYQMLRGSVIIFTALLAVAFLKRVINLQKWLGITAVLTGLAVVGLSDFFFNPTTFDLNSVITGDELVVMAQIIIATQMVVEEKLLGQLDVNALLAVGLEGLYGFTVLSLLSIPMYWIPVWPPFSNSPEYRLEDMLDAFAMLKNEWEVRAPVLAIVLNISVFNWAGVSVTKELSATTRMVLDSCRTLIIWAVTLGLGWQNFNYLQIFGFLILTCGIFIYNDMLTCLLLGDVTTCKFCKKSEKEVPIDSSKEVRKEAKTPEEVLSAEMVAVNSSTPPDYSSVVNVNSASPPIASETKDANF